jgi:hypothetical protein
MTSATVALGVAAIVFAGGDCEDRQGDEKGFHDDQRRDSPPFIKRVFERLRTG